MSNYLVLDGRCLHQTSQVSLHCQATYTDRRVLHQFMWEKRFSLCRTLPETRLPYPRALQSPPLLTAGTVASADRKASSPPASKMLSTPGTASEGELGTFSSEISSVAPNKQCLPSQLTPKKMAAYDRDTTSKNTRTLQNFPPPSPP